MAFAAAMLFATNVTAADNSNGKFALHYAGPHSSKTNTCDFTATACGDIVVNGGNGDAAYDIYVIATNVGAIAGIRYFKRIGHVSLLAGLLVVPAAGDLPRRPR